MATQAPTVVPPVLEPEDAEATGDEAANASDGDGAAGDDQAGLDRQAFVEIVDAVLAGEIVDPAGNIVIVHSARRVVLDELVPDPALAAASLNSLGDRAEVVAVDLGWCTAGEASLGTAGATAAVEFSTARHGDAPVARATVVTGSVPIVSPSFDFPPAGECARGWLALAPTESTDTQPDATQSTPVVRYLATSSGSSGVERSLYQWATESTSTRGQPDSGIDGGHFGIGETVTYHAGLLAGTTVTPSGWAELVLRPDPSPATRAVGVLVEVCPAGGNWPTFGLALDGFNLLAPTANAALEVSADTPDGPDADDTCRKGWVEFAVPLGVVPSGFFAADGVDSLAGYASWTLAGGALPAPE